MIRMKQYSFCPNDEEREKKKGRKKVRQTIRVCQMRERKEEQRDKNSIIQ